MMLLYYNKLKTVALRICSQYMTTILLNKYILQ